LDLETLGAKLRQHAFEPRFHAFVTAAGLNGRADRLRKSGRILYTYPMLLSPSDV
jgi:hypothetical protein